MRSPPLWSEQAIAKLSMRRFTRLTNGYSKRLENLEHNVALHFMNYNFCRIHRTLRVTPAMEAGVADHVCSLEEVVALIDEVGKNVANELNMMSDRLPKAQ